MEVEREEERERGGRREQRKRKGDQADLAGRKGGPWPSLAVPLSLLAYGTHDTLIYYTYAVYTIIITFFIFIFFFADNSQCCQNILTAAHQCFSPVQLYEAHHKSHE